MRTSSGVGLTSNSDLLINLFNSGSISKSVDGAETNCFLTGVLLTFSVNASILFFN